MATDFIYPTTLELKEIEQVKIPRLTAMRPAFQIFPLEDEDSIDVAWEQMDSFTGLQQVRGINGAPPKVSKLGAKRFVESPGAYGEFELIDEREIVGKRQLGSLDQRLDLRGAVMRSQERLLGRRLDRQESIIWTLLTTGTFSVPGPSGAILHTAAYTMQSYVAAVPWATKATATPLADLRNVKLMGRGTSARFDATATFYGNSTTLNNLYSNNNSADLYGRRTTGLGTYNSPSQIGTLFTGDNLPNIMEYDEGYLDDTGTFQLFIPTGKIVVVGTRPSGAPVGHFKQVRNANNPDVGPGAYTLVIDRMGQTVPRSIEVHDGFNGAITLEYPSSVVVMTV